MTRVLTSRLIAALLAAITFSSCRATYPERTAATGALIGAGTGALIGAASGNAGRGALIGAAAGGIAGGVYGRQRVRQHYRSFYSPAFHPYYHPRHRAAYFHPAYAYPVGLRARRPVPFHYAPRPYRFCY